MKTISISDAKEMSGMPIPRITGKIKVLFDRKTGTNDNGEWSMESGIMVDGEDEIKFTLSGCPKLPYSKGETVVFRCKEGKKGLTGVKIKTDEYKGKNEPVVWVTPSSVICSGSEETDDIPMEFDKSGESMTATEARSAPKANVEPKKAIPADGVQEVKKRVMQYVNLRYITDEAADFICQGSISADLKKDVSSCFFIQGIRDGLHLKLPDSKPLLQPREATEGQEKLDKALNEMFPQDQEF